MKFIDDFISKIKGLKNLGTKGLTDVSKKSKGMKEYEEKFKKLRGLVKEKKTDKEEIKFNQKEYNNKFKNLIKYLTENNCDIKSKKIIITIGGYSLDKRNLFEDSGFSNPYLTNTNYELFHNDYVNWIILPDSINFDISEQILFSNTSTKIEKYGLRCILKSIHHIQEHSKISSIIIRIKTDIFLNKLNNEDNGEELKNYFNNLYKSISYINNEFDYKIPVYILLTEVENLFGFDSFLKIMTKEERSQILGISSTSEYDDVYTENVSSQIMNDFKNILKSFISRKILDDIDARDFKNVLLFRNNFFGVLDKLHGYINSLFLHNSVNQRSLLRGIYACSYENGNSPQLPVGFEKYKSLMNENNFENAKNDDLKEDNLNGNSIKDKLKLCFFRDLFLKKITPDFSINLPSEHLIKLNRINSIVSLFLLLFVILSIPFLLYNFHQEMKTSYSGIESLFSNLSTSLKNRGVEQKSQIDSSTVNLTEVMDLFKDFNINKESQLSTIYSPFTMLIDFNKKINNLLERTLLVFEVRPVRNMLLEKLGSTIFIKNKNTTDDIVEDSYDNFFEYIEHLNSVEKIINDYNDLGLEMKVDNLNLIFQKIEDTDLSDFFPKTNIVIKNYGKKHNFKRINISDYKNSANNKFEYLLKKMMKAIENEYIINKNSKNLITYLDNPKQNTINNNYYEYIEKLNSYMDAINKKLDFYNTSSRIITAFGNEINLDKINIMIKNSAFLDNQYASNINIMIKESVTKRNKNVLEYNSVILGPLFEVDDKTGLKLAKPFVMLKNQLADLNQSDFVKSLKESQNNKKMSFFKDIFNWNNVDVDYLSRNIDIYNKFMGDKLNLFPDEIKISVKETVLLGLNRILLKELNSQGDGNGNKTDINIEKESTLFNRKKIGIIKVLKFYNENDRFNVDIDINSVTRDKITLYLNYFKEEVKKNVHYEPLKANFSWWDGLNPPAFNAYGVYDNRQLVDYVSNQTQVLAEILNENVAPLLEIDEQTDEVLNDKKPSSYTYWKNIKDEYESKDKNSSFLSLKNVILTTLTTITSNNCRTELNNIKKDYSKNDFFSFNKNEIISLLSGRCNKLYQNNVAYEYNDIIHAFNEKLAGKFPFVDDYNMEKSDEVDENALKYFFSQFDDFYDDDAKVQFILNSKNVYWRGASEFITKMKNVSDFMKILDSDEKIPKDSFFNLVVDFNRFKESELNTTGLLEKNIEISGKSISNLSLAKNIPWNPSEDVNITFRWAKDYDQVPSLNENINTEKYSNNLDTKNKTVSFLAKNKWSLVYMIRKNSMNKSQFYYSQNLLFKVPIKNIRNDNTNEKSIENSMSKIVIKIKFINKDNDSSFTLPVFPDQVETIRVTDS